MVSSPLAVSTVTIPIVPEHGGTAVNRLEILFLICPRHGGDHAAIKPRRRNLAIFWKAVVILRPQLMNDERIRSRPALHIGIAGASLGSASAEGWRSGQGVKIELARCVLPRILCRRRSGGEQQRKQRQTQHYPGHDHPPIRVRQT